MAESMYTKLCPTSRNSKELMAHRVYVDLGKHRNVEVKINGKAAGSIVL